MAVPRSCAYPSGIYWKPLRGFVKTTFRHSSCLSLTRMSVGGVVILLHTYHPYCCAIWHYLRGSPVLTSAHWFGERYRALLQVCGTTGMGDKQEWLFPSAWGLILDYLPSCSSSTNFTEEPIMILLYYVTASFTLSTILPNTPGFFCCCPRKRVISSITSLTVSCNSAPILKYSPG